MFKNFLIIIAFIFFANSTKAQHSTNFIEDFFSPKTTVGGYGELHYNQVNSETANTKKNLDFHRFVLFYSHSWTEKWSFRAEIEIEHNFVKEGEGELSIEQAYLNYRANRYFGVRAGVLLNSVGIINEVHEPPTFLSVERPEYSKYLIPTTWFGNGAAIFGNAGGFDYVFTAMEGLDGNKLTSDNIRSSGIRKGRQNGFNSNAKSILLNGRINYSGWNGIIFGGSYSFNNAIAETGNIQVGLSEFHFSLNKYNIVAIGEIANIAYGNSEINNSFGYYFDLGYDFGDFVGYSGSIIPFVRYTDINTANSTVAGGSSEEEFHKTKWMIGLAVKPIEEVVLKIDYAEQTLKNNNTVTQLLNVGIGYMF